MPTFAMDQSVILNYSDDNWDVNPANPRQWPSKKKWQAMAIVSFYTFFAPLSTSLAVSALPEIAMKYDIKNTSIVAMILSIFFLSYGLGPLVSSPLSEMYGRAWILHGSNILNIAFNLGCAYSSTPGSLIAFRFLAGWPSGVPLVICGGVISDLFPERERAVAMALVLLVPLVGVVVGPIAGGFIAQTLSVKYIFIVSSGIGGMASLIGLPFLRETYAPVIRMRLAHETSDPEKVVQIPTPKRESILHALRLNLSRPVMLLTHSFICFILSLYLALIFGIDILLSATFSELLSEVYHFSPSAVGFAYAGPGIGYLMAAVFGGKVSSKIYSMLADKNNGKGEPEMRIPSLILSSFVLPVGLLWYGWSAEARIHWIMPIIGAGIFAFGLLSTLLPVNLYLVDAFAFPASAVAAAGVFQSLLGFSFPLFGQDLYVKLGYGGGYSLLAGLAIVIGIPFPIWIWYKGEDMRKRSSLTR